jgi:hypothetical protein
LPFRTVYGVRFPVGTSIERWGLILARGKDWNPTGEAGTRCHRRSIHPWLLDFLHATMPVRSGRQPTAAAGGGDISASNAGINSRAGVGRRGYRLGAPSRQPTAAIIAAIAVSSVANTRTWGCCFQLQSCGLTHRRAFRRLARFPPQARRHFASPRHRRKSIQYRPQRPPGSTSPSAQPTRPVWARCRHD